MSEYGNLDSMLSGPGGPRIYCLVKLGSEKYMQGLRGGQIYCRHLSFYRSYEGDPRQDTHEGLQGIFQSDRIELRLTTKNGDVVVINSETGLKDQVYVSAGFDSPVFCLHAIHAGPWSDRTFGEQELEAFKSYIQIPESLSKFGTHVWVLTNPDEFVDRLTARCEEQGIAYEGGLVRYVDPKTAHGTIPRQLLAFVKRNAYEEEREFRLVFRGTSALPDPFILDVGSLADISQVMPLDEFRRSISITWPETPE